MGWYRVIKTIKGRPYVYEQRTWREGKKVRTESRYIGPLSEGGHGGGTSDSVPQTSAFDGVNTTSRILYHGARDGLEGELKPSASGIFGPGFYLASRKRAADFAQYDPKFAANREAWGELPPQHAGRVQAFDVSELRLKVLASWEAYFDLVDELLKVEQGYATDADKLRVQELLQQQGYDGIEVKEGREEVVVFSASLHKLKGKPRRSRGK